MSSNNPLDSWVGHPCTSVERWEHSWAFRFGDAGALTVECPWRVISEGRIAFSGDDDRRSFGLPEPLDVKDRARDLLGGKQVTAVDIHRVSADLRVLFSGDVIFELFNNSAGYEGWNAVAVRNGKRLNVIAQGGGALLGFEEPEHPEPGMPIYPKPL